MEIRNQLDALMRQASGGGKGSLPGIAKVFEQLHHFRNEDSDWKTLVTQQIQPHPLTEWFRQCPLTDRTAAKPRGYAGDAVMIDFIYGTGRQPPGLDSAEASAIYSYVSASPPSKAVRYRRYRLADLVDKVSIDAVHRGAGPIRVLSVAAGHAREMLLSTAFQRGLVSEFVALDQDEASLCELSESLSGHGAEITTVASSIRKLLTGKHELGQFDVIYSAGLYDYLETSVASRLTQNIFSMLKPRGRLLYANFAKGILSAGYMEAIMDWWLILRTEEETASLAGAIDPNAIAKMTTYRDPDDHIHFVELQRAIAAANQ